MDIIKSIEHEQLKNKIPDIKNITLLGLAFIGGTIGGLIAMYVFRHKTQKDYYTVGLWLMIIMQIILLIYLFNR